MGGATKYSILGKMIIKIKPTGSSQGGKNFQVEDWFGGWSFVE